MPIKLIMGIISTTPSTLLRSSPCVSTSILGAQFIMLSRTYPLNTQPSSSRPRSVPNTSLSTDMRLWGSLTVACAGALRVLPSAKKQPKPSAPVTIPDARKAQRQPTLLVSSPDMSHAIR